MLFFHTKSLEPVVCFPPGVSGRSSSAGLALGPGGCWLLPRERVLTPGHGRTLSPARFRWSSFLRTQSRPRSDDDMGSPRAPPEAPRGRWPPCIRGCQEDSVTAGVCRAGRPLPAPGTAQAAGRARPPPAPLDQQALRHLGVRQEPSHSSRPPRPATVRAGVNTHGPRPRGSPAEWPPPARTGRAVKGGAWKLMLYQSRPKAQPPSAPCPR